MKDLYKCLWFATVNTINNCYPLGLRIFPLTLRHNIIQCKIHHFGKTAVKRKKDYWLSQCCYGHQRTLTLPNKSIWCWKLHASHFGYEFCHLIKKKKFFNKNKIKNLTFAISIWIFNSHLSLFWSQTLISWQIWAQFVWLLRFETLGEHEIIGHFSQEEQVLTNWLV